MIRKEQFLFKLRKLKNNGGLPKSECGNTFIAFLGPLITANVIVEQRAGNGRRLVVRNAPTLAAFIERNFPDHEADGKLPQRVIGVKRFRDSKAFASDNPEIVQVRGWKENVLQRHGVPIDVVGETSLHSVFSFQLGGT